MGVESTNYVFRPEGEGVDLEPVLRTHGAQPAPEGQAGDFVLRDDDYWIDVQTSQPGSAVSIRVALTNPEPVLPRLRSLLAALLEDVGGQILDVDGDERLDEMTDESWAEVQARFVARQRQFRASFGPITAAVSADRVFDLIASESDGAASP